MSDEPIRGALDRSLLEETAEDLYEHAPCGYLSTLPDGTIVRVNQTLLDWGGYSRQALLAGTRFQTLLTMGSRIYYETHQAPLLQMQGFVNEIALDLRCADGRILPVMANAVQRRSEDGVDLFTRITLFDSTDRRRYEHELQLARRRAEQNATDKGDLLAMLSHDIRNPLNAMMGVIQLLGMGELTEPQQRNLRRLKSASENILNLVERVLQISRAESDSYRLQETPFSVRSIVDDVISTYGTAAEQKALRLGSSVDACLPAQLVGDPIALRQILSNLVANAIKFTDHGEVTITLSCRDVGRDGVTLDFAVADTGIGIPSDRLDRIFEMFTQASYETERVFGGTGLGLSIARKLLTLYGSAIHVASVVGEGSTFSFSLRLPMPPPAAMS